MDRGSGLSKNLESRLEQRQSPAHTGTLVVSETETYVGDTVTLKGRNLPANDHVDLVWHTAEGGWGVLGGNKIIGPQFQKRTERVATVITDEDGAFTEQWTVPEDYGGEHKLEARTADGASVAEAKLSIVPWFEIDRSRAKLGGVLTVTGYGIGPTAIYNNYQISWDNCAVGILTGTMNRGTATAKIRAAGPKGEHIVQVWRSVHGLPFLQNNTQSPLGPVGGDRQIKWSVTVEEPEAEPDAAWMDPLVDEDPIPSHYPEFDTDSDASLRITPNCGPPGTTAFIHGQNFPADTSVNLVWYVHEGNRVTGDPITPEPRPDVLPTVTTDSQGAFEVEITIPRSIGSTRPIVAEIDGRSVAVTGFMMQPELVDFSPTAGPVGTDIEIAISGVGWPTYENSYYFVYDNKPMGHICGLTMDDESIIRIEIPATGEPGYHTLDAYPGFFKTEDEIPMFEHKPHLSYMDNHPIRSLPGLHYTFEVTD